MAGAGLSRRLRASHLDEDGSSPVTSVAGVLMFLGFLLLAAQTSIHLYAVSTSTAVLFDEARRVAAASSYDCAQAQAAVERRLGRWGEQVTITCSGDRPGASHVELRLRGPSPANLVSAFGTATGLATFDRTVRVRVERFRP